MFLAHVDHGLQHSLELLTAPASSPAGTYAVLGKRRARVVREELREGSNLFSILAYMPAQASFGLADDLRRRTSGGASAALMLSHWERLQVCCCLPLCPLCSQCPTLHAHETWGHLSWACETCPCPCHANSWACGSVYAVTLVDRQDRWLQQHLLEWAPGCTSAWFVLSDQMPALPACSSLSLLQRKVFTYKELHLSIATWL